MPAPLPPTPPAAEGDPVPALEARLGVSLPDPALARAALTHRSFVNEHRGEPLADNERLEFLGDAVLDLAVSQRLMERFPEAREGELSKMRAALVDEPALARLARELELGPLLRLGRGEELTGGRDKASLLADALEAVLAVLFLSGGLDAALALLDRFLSEAFARADAGTLDRDFKTQMQEAAQGHHRVSPRYRVVAETGPDHAKVFEVEVEVKGEVLGRGSGRSKKDAEQAAARVGLGALEAARPEGAEPPPPPTMVPAVAAGGPEAALPAAAGQARKPVARGSTRARPGSSGKKPPVGKARKPVARKASRARPGSSPRKPAARKPPRRPAR